jgi:hypothetical protein
VVSVRQYLKAVYDHVEGRTGVKIESWEIRERVGLTEDEDRTEGHEIRLRLEKTGMLEFVPNTLHQKFCLTEAGKAEVEG